MVIVPSMLFAVAMAALAPGLGLAAHLLILALFVAMLSVGRLFCRILGQDGDPFLALVAGFLLLSHAMLAADFLSPGAHWQVAAALGLFGLLGWRNGTKRSPSSLSLASAAALSLFIALYSFSWAVDIAPRLSEYRATGRFPFWVDMFVHAGNLAHFASEDAIGRGMLLLADQPAPLYHYASFLPPALLPRLAGVPLLDATLLAWVPLGVLIMAAGVASLGLALGGSRLAALALCGLALLSSSFLDPLHNGWLSFSWLLETAPGTAYSIGVSCAALAAFVRWTRDQRLGSLALVVLLTAGCFLVRFNTFLWLAPTVVLGVVAGWRRLSPQLRAVLVALGLIGLAALFIGLSWPNLRAAPLQFLLGYMEYVHQSNQPTAYDGLYLSLVQQFGRPGAALAGLGLIFLGILGLWLPALVVLAVLAKWCRQTEAADVIPFLLLAVAAIAIVLAPVARNGDITEFRHRPGPLIAAVGVLWTLHFALLAFEAPLARAPRGRTAPAIAVIAALSLGVHAMTISAAKRPTAQWGAAYFNLLTSRDLLALAPLLAADPASRPRFAVADQPQDATVEDDASRLVALSGTPAYISCTSFLLKTGGAVGDEARRRMAVIEALAKAPNLEALQSAMRTAGVTHYVVTKPADIRFDPERLGAIGHSGSYAVYRATPPSPLPVSVVNPLDQDQGAQLNGHDAVNDR